MIEFNNIKDNLNQVGEQIEELFNKSFEMKKHLQQVMLRTAALQSAVFFSTEMMTKLFPAINYELRLYDQLAEQMKWLQSLLMWVMHGKLNPSLLAPTDVKRILRQVMTDLENNHWGLDLIFKTVTEVYTKAAVDYWCINNDIVLQISLFIHSFLDEPWQLFELKSVYILYSLDPGTVSETYIHQAQTHKTIHCTGYSDLCAIR